ncbi:potassium channel family protein [Burkholderia sp. L27(2015)]|uniref:potassium channel family protein n=1 Tax=Burkholderia sp. L27(2015) TaxID=1641858 RepID=UPI0020B175CA|nr:potassium channel family protein [Burkholderia sp. L27(2015)]
MQQRIGSMAVLLFLLLINIFVVPFMVAPDGISAQIVRDVLLSLILLSGAATAWEHRPQFVAIALIASLAIVAHWTRSFIAPEKTLGLLDGTTIFSLGILCAVLGTKVFGGGAVTFDRILGAIALYILIGVVWAEAYQLVSIHVPGAYAGIAHDGGPSDRSIWVYFSFVTLTTLGYGDITPVAQSARSLAIMEALIGQLYPAIVLARLISLQVTSGGSGTKQT